MEEEKIVYALTKETVAISTAEYAKLCECARSLIIIEDYIESIAKDGWTTANIKILATMAGDIGEVEELQKEHSQEAVSDDE